MRPAKYFEEKGDCGKVPDRNRGQPERELQKTTLNTFIETTKPQNLTDMEWINTLGGFKKISENWNSLESSLKKDVSELLLKDSDFKQAMMSRNITKPPEKKQEKFIDVKKNNKELCKLLGISMISVIIGFLISKCENK